MEGVGWRGGEVLAGGGLAEGAGEGVEEGLGLAGGGAGGGLGWRGLVHKHENMRI